MPTNRSVHKSADYLLAHSLDISLSSNWPESSVQGLWKFVIVWMNHFNSLRIFWTDIWTSTIVEWIRWMLSVFAKRQWMSIVQSIALVPHSFIQEPHNLHKIRRRNKMNLPAIEWNVIFWCNQCSIRILTEPRTDSSGVRTGKRNRRVRRFSTF